MERKKTSFSVFRKEYGYAGIYWVASTKEGEIILGDKKLPFFQIEKTRIIENPPVEGALSSPLKIFFDPSLACPLNCPFCLASAPEIRKGRKKIPSLSKSQVQEINRQIIEAGVLQVKIGGGEPFIYPYFWDMIKELGEAGIVLSTSTSGVTLNERNLLSDEKIELLKRYRVKISISIDGEPSYHNALRGKEGLFETALLGRERLIRQGINPQKIEFRATIANSFQSMRQIDYLNQLSIRLNTRLRLRLALPSGSAVFNDTAVIYPNKEFWLFYEKVRKYANENPLLAVEEIFRFDKPAYVRAGLDCGAGTRSAFINAHGDFMPCGFIDEYFTPPSHNLFKDKRSLLKLWQTGEAFLAVRDYFKKENENNPCAKCSFVHSCQGGCPAVRLSAKLISDPRCPLEKRVYLPIKTSFSGKRKQKFFLKDPILGIFAHPDDESFAAGGFFSYASQAGCSVYIFTLTSGEKGNNCLNAKDLGKLRKEELKKATEVLGISQKFLFLDKLPDGQLKKHRQVIRKKIGQKISKLNPGMVVAIHPLSTTHPDHIVIGETLLEIRKKNDSFLLLLQFLPHKFQPLKDQNVFVFKLPKEILNKKEEAIQQYRSQKKDINRILPNLLPEEYFMII